MGQGRELPTAGEVRFHPELLSGPGLQQPQSQALRQPLRAHPGALGLVRISSQGLTSPRLLARGLCFLPLSLGATASVTSQGHQEGQCRQECQPWAVSAWCPVVHPDAQGTEDPPTFLTWFSNPPAYCPCSLLVPVGTASALSPDS